MVGWHRETHGSQADGSRVLKDGTIIQQDGTRILADGTRILAGQTSQCSACASWLWAGASSVVGLRRSRLVLATVARAQVAVRVARCVKADVKPV